MSSGIAPVINHYTLKSVKALRNAVCHNNCIINGFSSKAPAIPYTTPRTMLDSMSERGLKPSRARSIKMRNPRVTQIAATLYASSEFCDGKRTRRRHAEEMETVREAFASVHPLCPADGSLTSFLDFILELVDIWVPVDA